MELPPRYNFNDVEDKWCKDWEEKNLFHAQANPQKKSYTIVIPPPNVTGILHMGHALNNTLQDIIIRYKRMQGLETLWMPGTDHAGIATQNVVEKQLAKEGKSRQDVGREEFLKRLWEWKNQYGDTIIHQLKKLGSSCDWERTRFTMDEPYSAAVKHAFVSLYKKGLIYQGQYIINWCPRCQTALSDEEAEHQDTQGSLYHIRYPFKDDPKKFVTVATTRPETMLGDTAVAVNPKDKRYKKLIGKTLILPILKREIKIISDEFVDPKFGTGAVKVTPAHDPNDFAMGKRHNLEFINIMYPDARLNKNAGPFAELDRFTARSKVIETLKDSNLLEKMEQHSHAVGHCYRCDTVVEPYLSKQWFVKMAPLAKPAIAAVKKGKIKFTPARWTNVYLNWMENIRDWCISRQIWWGHRIPVWYCSHCPEGKNIIVSETTPNECPHCHSKKLKQDEDVLDTWFSSWLWPFATLGWPQKNKDLEYFYPTASLFTASEIIFFWVARMIMAGYEFMGDLPFSDVYIHGTVRDAQGRKMSKSLGNALDPLEIIKEYGADALRFSLIINSGQDLFISKEKFEIGRNFANKIWNASRLILMNTAIENKAIDLSKDIAYDKLDLPSQWIISRFYSTLSNVEKAVENYRFSEAENLVYEFFWHNFCDWYLEISKNNFTDPVVQKITFAILKQSAQMMHPFMPFVTEELWTHLKSGEETIAQSAWPKVHKKLIHSAIESEMQTLTELIAAIRNTRAAWNVKPHEEVECHLTSSAKKDIDLLRDNGNILKSLAKIKTLHVDSHLTKPADSAAGIVGKIKFFIPLGSLIDLAKEKQRILSQIQEQTKMSAGLTSRLKNKDFLKKAPAEVVEKEKARLTSIQTKLKELKEAIKNLG
ncbi:MAG: valine--tRNA ligase [Omnitrophica WOR_2 bacterium RIFCSPHIGHO2_01_FULL_48_9]|nr:MAG: valine--tRNA ligase [Omnitrophica WOR_2 bacterium RIFCSPHIGHO2_01_FULL_48_9]